MLNDGRNETQQYEGPETVMLWARSPLIPGKGQSAMINNPLPKKLTLVIGSFTKAAHWLLRESLASEALLHAFVSFLAVGERLGQAAASRLGTEDL